MKIRSFAGVVVACVGLTITMLWLMNGGFAAVSAAPAGELHVCSSGCPYASVRPPWTPRERLI